MTTIETTLITAVAVMITLAPTALDAWLARRDAARTSGDEAMLERAAGGAE